MSSVYFDQSLRYVPHMITSHEAALAPGYLQDIHLQPDALERVLTAGLAPDVRALLDRAEQFDRIVMTGMGASLFGQYPSFLRLANAGWPVWSIETAELLGPARGLITEHTLLWITSQSGGTAEVVALLEQLPVRPAAILGVTNDPASPLASGASTVLELHAGAEHTVSTRSYLNTLAASALATSHILGEAADRELGVAPERLADYLREWERHKTALDRALPESTMFILGRGASLAATLTGSLIIKEAAGRSVEGLSVPQFRHGPLEMTSPDMSVILLAGDPVDHALNAAMRRDLTSFGARVAWVDTTVDSDGLSMPNLPGPVARPIAEIIPLQLLSVILAERADHEPGTFHKIGKVTRSL
jgi:glutamine---fructose-6-phosphate transaminase (isomerizing)